MIIPDCEALMLPLLKCIKDGEIHSVEETTYLIINQFKYIGNGESKLLPGDGYKRDRNLIRMAIVLLGKAALLESPKPGHLRITERGAKLLSKDISEINEKTLIQYDEYKEFCTSIRSEQPLNFKSVLLVVRFLFTTQLGLIVTMVLIGLFYGLYVSVENGSTIFHKDSGITNLYTNIGDSVYIYYDPLPIDNIRVIDGKYYSVISEGEYCNMMEDIAKHDVNLKETKDMTSDEIRVKTDNLTRKRQISIDYLRNIARIKNGRNGLYEYINTNRELDARAFYYFNGDVLRVLDENYIEAKKNRISDAYYKAISSTNARDKMVLISRYKHELESFRVMSNRTSITNIATNVKRIWIWESERK